MLKYAFVNFEMRREEILTGHGWWNRLFVMLSVFGIFYCTREDFTPKKLESTDGHAGKWENQLAVLICFKETG